MTPARQPRPAERRSEPRLCAEGRIPRIEGVEPCPLQVVNHSGYCSRHRQAYMAQAFLDEGRVARMLGAAS